VRARAASLPPAQPCIAYVTAALDELAAGQHVTVPAAGAYGCSIKYKTS
jgi:hypothetical protein